MSHAAGGATAEPNLIPLLDLVFQLVMFFMMCTNFVMEQFDADIRLPLAQAAKPVDRTQTSVLYLNIDSKGRVLTVGAVLGEQPVIDAYLKREYADAERLAKDRKQAGVDTMVVIRADRDANFAKVYQVMRSCKNAGFRKLQLRASVQR